MAATEALYGVAVAVLPALLFGGAVIGVPARWGLWGKAAGVGIAFFVLFALLFAVQGLIEPVGAGKQRFIVFVLVGATVAASVAAALRPDQSATMAAAVAAAIRRTSGDTPIESEPARDSTVTPKHRWLLWAAVVGLGFAFIAAASIDVTASLDRAKARTELDQAERAKLSADSVMAAAETRVVAARASALSTLNDLSPSSGEIVGTQIQDWITGVDGVVQPVLRGEAQSDMALEKAQKALAERSQALKEHGLIDLETLIAKLHLGQRAVARMANEVWLVNLAAAELISAEQSRLDIKAGAIAADQRHKQAQNDTAL